MPDYAIRAQLHKVVAAVNAGDRDLAAARLAWFTADVMATISTRLDTSTLFQLQSWGILK